MKRTLSLPCALLTLFVATGSVKATETQAVRPVIDQRIELTSIVARLAGYQEYRNDQFKSYAQDVDRYFAPFQHHPAIEYAKEIRQQFGISFDAVPSLAFHLNPPPTLTPRVDVTHSALDARWTKAAAEKFSTLLGRFYRDADCAKFFRDHATLYREVERRFQATLNHVHFEWYRVFYGEQPKGHFHLVIGLLNGGGNYGPRVINADGSEDLYAVMATYRTDASGLPVYDDLDLPTIIHEYNHSFVNKLIEDNDSLFAQSGSQLFNRMQDKMRRQGYGAGRTVIIESVVRACVVKYLQLHPTGPSTATTQLAEEEERGFVWTGKLVSLLGEYEREREKYPTLRSFIPRIAKFFDAAPAQIPVFSKELEAREPKVIGVTPFENGAQGVDPATREIRIVFDRKMSGKTGFYSIEARNPIVGNPAFSRDGRTLIAQIKVENGHEYGVGLSGFYFRSAEGYTLGHDFLLRFATKGFAVPPPDQSFGYKIEGSQVIFVFQRPDWWTSEIQSVSVAGEFNDWKPGTAGYLLSPSGQSYTLSLPAESLGKPGQKRQFKFVINGSVWVTPASQALNVQTDSGGNKNLVLWLPPHPSAAP